MIRNIITAAIGRLQARLHLVLALLAGAPLVLLGLTGTVLTFGGELDVATAGVLRRAEGRGATAGTIAGSATDAAGVLPHTLFFPQDPGLAVEAWLDAAGTRRVYLEGRDARVLGLRDERRAWLGTLRALHLELLAGDRGHTAIGVAGLALLGLVSTGVARWWRVRRNVPALRVRTPVAGVRGPYDLHRVAGLAASLLLGLSGLTGAALVFPAAATTVLGAPPRSPAPRSESSTPFDLATLDALVARAAAALPHAEVTRIHLPQAPGAPLRVRLRAPREPHPFGMSFVHIGLDGMVLRVDDARHAPWQDRLLALRFPVHTGVLLGTPGRIAMAVAGLAPLWLSVTGLLFWRRRVRRRAPTSPTPAVARTSHGST